MVSFFFNWIYSTQVISQSGFLIASLFFEIRSWILLCEDLDHSEKTTTPSFMNSCLVSASSSINLFKTGPQFFKILYLEDSGFEFSELIKTGTDSTILKILKVFLAEEKSLVLFCPALVERGKTLGTSFLQIFEFSQFSILLKTTSINLWHFLRELNEVAGFFKTLVRKLIWFVSALFSFNNGEFVPDNSFWGFLRDS